MAKPDNSSAQERGFRKTREGIVVSDKMDKTITVEVSDRVAHGLYSKVMSRTHKLKAHDENNSAGTGDRVLIMETRPISASKRWRLVQIIGSYFARIQLSKSPNCIHSN